MVVGIPVHAPSLAPLVHSLGPEMGTGSVTWRTRTENRIFACSLTLTYAVYIGTNMLSLVEEPVGFTIEELLENRIDLIVQIVHILPSEKLFYSLN